MPAPLRHSLFEDLQALAAAALLGSLGLGLLKHAGLITGGTVGLAFLGHYASAAPLGALLFAINLPFIAFAWFTLGRAFTLKTLCAIGLLAVATDALPRVLAIERLDPLFAAITGGLLAGVSMIILFRHGASLGGLNIVVHWLQERFGWRAGYLQLAIDAAIIAAALALVPVERILVSLLGAAVLNLTLAINHRPGRYMAA
ncbi:YitT family protein [Accumulibacter sp.]|uniref:YitT family protein n=1 Tax=Accumulibacter sp. TaxID=2053492 RepID=UPI00263439BE|nr:YitT family protein [Accumulibacter sp.]MDS4055245.1 YitT family protein [Accumulibacter sp.]HMW79999.1 YitT family protein [Accumulibacter sp.]HNB68170.1 YitT family protein [Accumulibacter sp.]HNG15620.1 YitT family protein [Accumulibacter sp.]HNG86330.1 YitT family protein [Accumulibacter sp.]